MPALSTSVVTEWNPPHQWATRPDGWVPGSPPIANEWSVESRAGGTCIVRIVQSLFASTDDWDNQLEGARPARERRLWADESRNAARAARTTRPGKPRPSLRSCLTSWTPAWPSHSLAPNGWI